MRYGVLIKNFHGYFKDEEEKESGTVFTFNNCDREDFSFCDIYPYHGAGIQPEFAVEISESEYNRLKPTPKPHTITLDGKEFTLSHESCMNLKKGLEGII